MTPDGLAERIAAGIASALGVGFAATATAPVGGGCIHKALRLSGKTPHDTRDYFVKVNDAANAAMFEAEDEGLAALHAAGSITVPRVVARGGEDEHAWLVIEWLELQALDAASAAQLGEGLAAQHKIAQPRFGWERDNFIGASAQPNGWSDDWLDFWRHRRLVPQLRLAAKNRLPSKLMDGGERLAADCEAFFRGYAPHKSLLHGDLWSGNAARVAGSGPCVFDPAAYVGDREADVAMTELFGGFPRDFLGAYANTWPLHDGYRVRRDFYNLYHVLNHANLFAGGYVRQAQDSIGRLLAEIA